LVSDDAPSPQFRAFARVYILLVGTVYGPDYLVLARGADGTRDNLGLALAHGCLIQIVMAGLFNVMLGMEDTLCTQPSPPEPARLETVVLPYSFRTPLHVEAALASSTRSRCPSSSRARGGSYCGSPKKLRALGAHRPQRKSGASKRQMVRMANGIPRPPQPKKRPSLSWAGWARATCPRDEWGMG